MAIAQQELITPPGVFEPDGEEDEALAILVDEDEEDDALAAFEEIDGVLYRYCEEEPVVQGEPHFSTANDVINMVRGVLIDQPEAGIFGDVFVYWVKGNPRKVIAPDVIVIPRSVVQELERQSIYLWEQPSEPVLAMEVLSTRTRRHDLNVKFRRYREELKIPELYYCDPRKRKTKIWGYRLVDGKYVPLTADNRGRLWSESIRAWIGIGAHGLVQIWNEAGEAMPRYTEALVNYRTAVREQETLRLAAEAAEQEAREKTQRVSDAERRIEELEAELRRLRDETG